MVLPVVEIPPVLAVEGLLVADGSLWAASASYHPDPLVHPLVVVPSASEVVLQACRYLDGYLNCPHSTI